MMDNLIIKLLLISSSALALEQNSPADGSCRTKTPGLVPPDGWVVSKGAFLQIFREQRLSCSGYLQTWRYRADNKTMTPIFSVWEQFGGGQHGDQLRFALVGTNNINGQVEVSSDGWHEYRVPQVDQIRIDATKKLYVGVFSSNLTGTDYQSLYYLEKMKTVSGDSSYHMTPNSTIVGFFSLPEIVSAMQSASGYLVFDSAKMITDLRLPYLQAVIGGVASEAASTTPQANTQTSPLTTPTATMTTPKTTTQSPVTPAALAKLADEMIATDPTIVQTPTAAGSSSSTPKPSTTKKTASKKTTTKKSTTTSASSASDGSSTPITKTTKAPKTPKTTKQTTPSLSTVSGKATRARKTTTVKTNAPTTVTTSTAAASSSIANVQQLRDLMVAGGLPDEIVVERTTPEIIDPVINVEPMPTIEPPPIMPLPVVTELPPVPDFTTPRATPARKTTRGRSTTPTTTIASTRSRRRSTVAATSTTTTDSSQTTSGGDIFCNIPPMLEHASLYKQPVGYLNEKAQFACEPGYKMTDGTGEFACQFNGQWTGAGYCTVTSTACRLPMSSGYCDAVQQKWFYDLRSSSCRWFYYGGCGGTANRFDSYDQCLQVCGYLIFGSSSRQFPPYF